MNEREIKLIEQAKKGNQKAFGQLYKLYLQPVKSVIYSFVIDDYTVQDLVSTTFIKAFKKLNKFVANDSFEGWIRTIANNTCIDYTRKKNRQPNILSADDIGFNIQIEDETTNAEETIILKNKNQDLRNAISKLPERQRKAISMFYFENELYRNIAKELAVPIGTIKSDINRAKRQLKTIINNSV